MECSHRFTLSPYIWLRFFPCVQFSPEILRSSYGSVVASRVFFRLMNVRKPPSLQWSGWSTIPNLIDAVQLMSSPFQWTMSRLVAWGPKPAKVPVLVATSHPGSTQPRNQPLSDVLRLIPSLWVTSPSFFSLCSSPRSLEDLEASPPFLNRGRIQTSCPIHR